MSACFRRIASAFPHPIHPAPAPNTGPENSHGLLALQPEIRHRLKGLVHKLCHDPNQYEDLEQVALTCYWQAEETSPGKTPSWYMQHCASCIRNYLRAGRSVDSLKRRNSVCAIEECPDVDVPLEWDALEEVSVRDCLRELMRRLDRAERQTLQLLSEECTVREIAQDQHIAHATVIARHRHIRAIALGLGIHP
jgi:DNA-directed RNA polymerase specialized sigma24 family protein